MNIYIPSPVIPSEVEESQYFTREIITMAPVRSIDE